MSRQNKNNKYSKRGLFIRTIPYILKNKFKILICIAETILISLLVMYMPRITKEILDTYIKDAKSFSEIDIDGIRQLL